MRACIDGGHDTPEEQDSDEEESEHDTDHDTPEEQDSDDEEEEELENQEEDVGQDDLNDESLWADFGDLDGIELLEEDPGEEPDEDEEEAYDERYDEGYDEGYEGHGLAYASSRYFLSPH